MLVWEMYIDGARISTALLCYTASQSSQIEPLA